MAEMNPDLNLTVLFDPGLDAVGLGRGGYAAGANAIAVGAASGTADDSTTDGTFASGDNSIAVGPNALATAARAIQIGAGTLAVADLHRIAGANVRNVVETDVSDTTQELAADADVHLLTSNGDSDADAVSLADGDVVGQEVTIVYAVADAGGDSIVVTPDNLVGGSTVTFADVGDSANLLWTEDGWVVTANNGGAIA